MAKSQYSGDSPFPSPFSEHSGMSGSPETFSVKSVPVPALPAVATPFMPPPYILMSGAAMYIGETNGSMRRMCDRGLGDQRPPLGEIFPTCTCID